MSRHHSSTTPSSRFCSRHPSRSDSSCIRCFCSAVNLVRNRFLAGIIPWGGGAVAGESWAGSLLWPCGAPGALELRESSMCGCGAEEMYGGGCCATGAGRCAGGGCWGGETERSSSYSEPSESESESSPSTPGSRSSGVSCPCARCGRPWSTVAGMGMGTGGAGSRAGGGGGGGGGEPSTITRRWKLRWQPQAAHLYEAGSAVLSSTTGIHSPQPSTACAPMAAAWFLRHSLYVGTASTGGGGGAAACRSFLTEPLG
uniref:Uncharacterized protein n=1 Tax=Triticum urartu TaxID=4572 RepID=A0A8R7QCU9_TRIUA